MTTLQKVKAYKDNDGHWYVIPEELATQFHSMLRDAEEQDEFGIDDAYEGFECTFGKYMTGGDLNLVQLWAEV
jgi:hypothetical protein